LRGDYKSPDVVQVNMVRHDVFRQVTDIDSAPSLNGLMRSESTDAAQQFLYQREHAAIIISSLALTQSSFACVRAPATSRIASVLWTTDDEMLTPDLKRAIRAEHLEARPIGCKPSGKSEEDMKVLVTGATGNVGSAVVAELLKRGAAVRALIRKPDADHKLPASVEVAIGDLLDPVSIEEAMKGVDKLFLLNAVSADELTQALITFGLAKRLKLKHITYLSVFKVEQFRDVPHFASKLAVESALREFGVPHTILRPGYYIQNDVTLKDALTGPGIYPIPLGTAGIAAVDIRDIAEAAAISLTEDGHDGQTYDLIGPALVNGPGNAEVWGKLLGKEIKYTGHNFDQWEQTMRGKVPAWMAFDLRMMFQGYFDRGFAATETEVTRITKLLGRAPRSYEDFAAETTKLWNA